MQISKYLVVNPRDVQWGLTVSTVGYEEIGVADTYPTRGHADGYYFDIDKGRVLNEYQLLYITEGEGIFNSAHAKDIPLKLATSSCCSLVSGIPIILRVRMDGRAIG